MMVTEHDGMRNRGANSPSCIVRRSARSRFQIATMTGRSLRTFSLAAVLSAIVAASVLAAPMPARLEVRSAVVLAQARNVDTNAQIVLLRGLANVFSRGMDELGERFTGYGFSPRVLNHRGWENVADSLAQNYRNGNRAPIIVIGHSLGANAAIRVAQRLNAQHVPVAYLAVFDPTHSLHVPSNVDTFVNFYQNNRVGRPSQFPPSRNESKVNLNLTTSPGLTHTNIDQSRRLQDIVVNRTLQITAR
jgi:hypothetical protein